MLSRDGRPTRLGDAIAHYGRIAKALHVLRLADVPGYRRQIKVQANLQEGRHALARKIFHGRSGQLCQRYEDGMEDRIGVLGLVLNAFVLFDTWYVDAALTQLRSGRLGDPQRGRRPVLAVRPPPHQRARPVLLPASRPARRAAAFA
ncbi:Tn3 family transposase [Streptomyces luomodiensis]|uniref:Tn3 family transposase n=1 Tax=Streptomyces luomodiensis TaxID=3026192 RepID=A0ABY9UPR7_9ACTN|nr:Tn3 family transposase [Streptomyces sp. SCA4-21]WNE93930.1 Tn3 family transposase [Streptomyces sp. SCA4-21]